LETFFDISHSKIDFKEEHALVIFYNLLCAMSFIHSANIMHRDLKPANILIDDQCSVKICDFGLSRSFEEKHPLCQDKASPIRLYENEQNTQEMKES
jgi:serine/threonine protein kinase